VIATEFIDLFTGIFKSIINHMHKLSILGGTFAQFHDGHKKLLAAAFEQSHHVFIGISQPVLYKDKFLAHTIEDYQTRENYVKEYLRLNNWLQRVTIIPIDAIWGNSLEEQALEAIFVTEVTRPGAELINNERAKIKFPLLDIITVPLVQSSDGKPITSERIRAGEIDREGNVYLDMFQRTLQLPESIREALREPLGKVVTTTDEVIKLLDTNQIVISVGDIITQSMIKAQYQPTISIIDNKTRRQTLPLADRDRSQTTILKTQNKHGTINPLAAQTLHNALRTLNASPLALSPSTIIIDGEEDLLALPAILLAPLGSIVLYGQYDVGVVVNEVTEEKKKEVRVLLQKFVYYG
jgi:uncharacterized protein (UPF0218 family)/phosphopantetheine adenylyltransferase